MKKKILMWGLCLFMTCAFVSCAESIEDTAPLMEKKASDGTDRKSKPKNLGGEAEGTDRKVRHKNDMGG